MQKYEPNSKTRKNAHIGSIEDYKKAQNDHFEKSNGADWMIKLSDYVIKFLVNKICANNSL